MRDKRGERLKYKEVKEFFNNEGYELLTAVEDDYYAKTRDRLDVKCSNGHCYNVVWMSFKSGKRCAKCKGVSRLEYEDVKKEIEKEGYILKSQEYKNTKTKLEVVCPEGHQWSMRFSDFQKGHRCSKCGGTKNFTLDEVNKYISEQGYKIISDFYKNARTKILVECSKKHVYETTFGNFRSGRRCKECRKEYLSKKFKLDYETVKRNIESVEGYILLSEDYTNSKTKLKIQHIHDECDNFIFEMPYNNFHIKKIDVQNVMHHINIPTKKLSKKCLK